MEALEKDPAPIADLHSILSQPSMGDVSLNSTNLCSTSLQFDPSESMAHDIGEPVPLNLYKPYALSLKLGAGFSGLLRDAIAMDEGPS